MAENYFRSLLNNMTGGPVTTAPPSKPAPSTDQNADPGFRAFRMKAMEMGAPDPSYQQYVATMAAMGQKSRSPGQAIPAPYSGDPAKRGLLGSQE